MCIFLIRRNNQEIRERFSRFEVGELAISSITESELRHGAEKSADPAKKHRQLDLFLLSLPVLPYNGDCERLGSCGDIMVGEEKFSRLDLVGWLADSLVSRPVGEKWAGHGGPDLPSF